MRQTHSKIVPACLLGVFLIGGTARAGAPQYTIIEIGTQSGHASSQGFNLSPSGRYATGRSNGGPGAVAFLWTDGAGSAAMPNLTSPLRNFCLGLGVNNAGEMVGTGATTGFGANQLPVYWSGGSVSQLPLPSGETTGRANDINNTGYAVGSVGGGSLQRGAVFAGGPAGTVSVITTTGPGGVFMTAAFGVNDANLAVGNGIDPGNAARNVGLVYDIGADVMIEVGALPGFNGALAFDISNAGHVVGSSMLNQGSGLPFVWTLDDGMTAIPLPAGTSQGSARGVNSSGWAVGTASSAFAIPFLYDGAATYRLQDLIPPGTGWDLSTNTSSSALAISDTGVIVGTGVFNGSVRAYAMIPVPPPCLGDINGDGAVNTVDLTLLLGNFGATVPANTGGDFDGNGAVNTADLVFFLGLFGTACD